MDLPSQQRATRDPDHGWERDRDGPIYLQFKNKILLFVPIVSPNLTLLSLFTSTTEVYITPGESYRIQ